MEEKNREESPIILWVSLEPGFDVFFERNGVIEMLLLGTVDKRDVSFSHVSDKFLNLFGVSIKFGEISFFKLLYIEDK